jgi:hypothetical protein
MAMPFFPKADPNDQNIAAARAKISGRIFPLLWNPILTNLGTMSNLLTLSSVKFAIVKLFILLVLVAFLAFAGPERLDPMLRAILYAPSETKPALLSLYGEENVPDPQIPVFVELKPGASLAIPGLRTQVGNLVTATLPLSQILALAEQPGVLKITASRPVEPLLDRSVPEVGAPALWHGSPSTTGEG